MAEPNKGYNPGVYRCVLGFLSNGEFQSNTPKEGFVEGIYVLTGVTVSGDGTTSPSENQTGLNRAIFVNVDADGVLNITDTPQEGYVSGVYRILFSNSESNDGTVPTFSSVVGTVSSGIWSPF